ncbi:hypothetical protein HaLaN_16915 [Haematococcus lacustris]|uniref:Uncharacterized protein n=1 Tax=Haematococcus lacustris TaxID=44745 RepID=A0A699ZLS8_HAELA|nr:hypothetical protein HaLaN_16915 [Haematococcus lacustris]
MALVQWPCSPSTCPPASAHVHPRVHMADDPGWMAIENGSSINLFRPSFSIVYQAFSLAATTPSCCRAACLYTAQVCQAPSAPPCPAGLHHPVQTVQLGEGNNTWQQCLTIRSATLTGLYTSSKGCGLSSASMTCKWCGHKSHIMATSHLTCCVTAACVAVPILAVVFTPQHTTHTPCHTLHTQGWVATLGVGGALPDLPPAAALSIPPG